MRRLSKTLVLIQGSPAFYCPGCNTLHIARDKKWNGDVDRPTFGIALERPGCSMQVSVGFIKFSPSSKHSLAGNYVALPNLPNWVK